LIGIPVASILGGPISGFILDHARWLGLSSWRWLLILEGVPAATLAFLVPFLLPSKPGEAKFLTADEKAWIAEKLEREDRLKLAAKKQSISVARTLLNPRVWHVACIGFCHGFASYTFSFWLPQVMKSLFGGRSNTLVGIAVMIPSLLALIAMVAASRHSDRTLERRYHLAILSVLAGIAFLLLGVPRSPLFSVVLFSAVAVGNYSFLPIFFSLPGEFLTGYSAAAGIALVTSVSNLGGFAGPFTVGLIRQRTGSFYPGLICAGIFFLVSASLAFVLPKRLSPAGERLAGTDVDLETNPNVLLEKA
jgi:ACS family tartrate transporter-like MFS transporter